MGASVLIGVGLGVTAVACAPADDTAAIHYLERVDALETAAGRYQLQLTPVPDPPVAGPAALVVVLDSGESDAAIQVEPWMPEHGHGTGADPAVTDEGGGTYRAEWVYAMPGYWELTLHISGEAGEDQAVVGYVVE